jgi:cytochrome c oxidase subunit 3
MSLLLTVISLLLWFNDIVIEGTFLGDHTEAVRRGIILGIFLFIISEVFAFLSIFWAFLHSSLSPTVELGQS